MRIWMVEARESFLWVWVTQLSPHYSTHLSLLKKLFLTLLTLTSFMAMLPLLVCSRLECNAILLCLSLLGFQNIHSSPVHVCENAQFGGPKLVCNCIGLSKTSLTLLMSLWNLNGFIVAYFSENLNFPLPNLHATKSRDKLLHK